MYIFSGFEDYYIDLIRYFKWIDYAYSPTSSTITMLICVIFFSYLVNNIMIMNSLFCNLLINLLIPIYNIIYNLLINNLGITKLWYAPFYIYLFLYIFIQNAYGLLPDTFAVTSHLSATVFLASIIWFTCLFKGFYNHGIKFLGLFCPSGVPLAIIPLLVFIETMSFCFRSISLGLRLFANVFAGHVLLETVGVFAFKFAFTTPTFFLLSSYLISIIPFIFFAILMVFELIVSFLQSYVFVILSIIYLTECYNMH